MQRLLINVGRALNRIIPDCVTLSQAVAFNMFLAFFPLFLLALGLFAITSHFVDAVREVPDRLSLILPPGSMTVLAAYFVRRVNRPWRWIFLGLGGTLLAGTQAMAGFIEGFRVIEGDLLGPTYWRRQLRALSLLCVTIVPMLAVVVLTVYGKQTREWIMLETGSASVSRVLELLFYAVVVFTLAMAVLVLLYRIGRPGHRGLLNLFPGATVSTVLWWAADISFGFYMRKMPYDFVYRGLAAAIGLLLWMFLTAIVVFIGAAYNSEVREAQEAARSTGDVVFRPVVTTMASGGSARSKTAKL